MVSSVDNAAEKTRAHMRPADRAVRALGEAAFVGALIGGALGITLVFGGKELAVGFFDRLLMGVCAVAAYLLGTVILALIPAPLAFASRRLAILPASLAGGVMLARWARALWGSAGNEWIGAMAAVLIASALFFRHRRAGRRRASMRGLLIACALSAAVLLFSAWTRPQALDARTPEMRRAERGTIEQIPADRREESSPIRIDPASKPRNVLLIVIDTLRADHLSTYGYALETSPTLDRFAEEGVLFERHWVQRPKTSPSVASIITGTYPYRHRVLKVRTRLPDEAVTLAEILKRNGMQTAGFVANPNVFAVFNFHQGFEHYSEIGDWRGNNRAAKVNDAVMHWLKKRHEDPFFAYIHYIDPHTPYDPPAEFKGRFAERSFYDRFDEIDVSIGKKNIGSIPRKIAIENLSTDVGLYVARYDEEIAYVDHEIGQLLRFLDDLGRRDDTLVIITSDHGETMAERGVFFNHGLFATENQVHVPLILRFPPWKLDRSKVSLPTQSIDVFPTVLEALALPREILIDGRSLLFAFLPQYLQEDRVARAFAEAGQSRSRFAGAVRGERWKIHYRPDGYDAERDLFSPRTLLRPKKVLGFLRALRGGHGNIRRWELYDLVDDPFETRDLLRKHPEIAERLAEELLDWLSRGDGRRAQELEIDTLPEDLAEKLRGLGYVH